MRLADWITEALHGPLQFRFFVQPLVAILLGMRDGKRDHDVGERPFVMGVLEAGGDRKAQLRAALHQIAVPLLVAIVVDGIVQIAMLGSLRLLSALGVGTLLIAIPYAAFRGLTNRALRERPRHPV